jgi:hypothetical protein
MPTCVRRDLVYVKRDLDGVGGLGAFNLVQLVHVVLETPKVAHVHLDFSDDAQVIAPLQENVDRQVSVPAAGSSLSCLVCERVSVHLEDAINTNHNTPYAQ